MDVLPNIDVSDVMEIPKVFRCDEQTLPCDHTTKYRYCLYSVFTEFIYILCFKLTSRVVYFEKKFTEPWQAGATIWISLNMVNLHTNETFCLHFQLFVYFSFIGKSIRAFTRLLAPAYDDGLMSPRSRSLTGSPLPSPRLVNIYIFKSREIYICLHFSAFFYFLNRYL